MIMSCLPKCGLVKANHLLDLKDNYCVKYLVFTQVTFVYYLKHAHRQCDKYAKQ